METIDYIVAWLIYLIASIAMSFLFWKIIKKSLWNDLAYVMQVTFVAIVFTPHGMWRQMEMSWLLLLSYL